MSDAVQSQFPGVATQNQDPETGSSQGPIYIKHSSQSINEMLEAKRLEKRRNGDRLPNRSSPPVLPPPFPRLTGIPSDAVYIGSLMLGPRIFYIPSSRSVLKAGLPVKSAEAEAMRLVANQTSVPVPEVFESYERDGFGFISMSRVEGRELTEVWPSLSDENRKSLVDELRSYIRQWQSINGDYYGAPSRLPCQDVFFSHLCLMPPKEKQYGPYDTREEYNNGLVEALVNSRPFGKLQFGEDELSLIKEITQLRDSSKVFSHGDIHPGNIFVDDSGKITGILDWGEAGYSIKERDYFEATLRARTHTAEWKEVVEMVFPEDVKQTYEILSRLNRQLVKYSGM